MNYPSDIKTRSMKRLKLILLPPKEQEDVTEDDVKCFYKRLANILISND